MYNEEKKMDLLTTNLSLLLNRDIHVTVALTGIYTNVSFVPLIFKLYNMVMFRMNQNVNSFLAITIFYCTPFKKYKIEYSIDVGNCLPYLQCHVYIDTRSKLDSDNVLRQGVSLSSTL